MVKNWLNIGENKRVFRKKIISNTIFAFKIYKFLLVIKKEMFKLRIVC